jgi:hypothetical protein
MSKIRVGGGVAGLIFTVGTALIFLVGVPPLRWFAVLALVVGLAVGVGLLLWHKRHPKTEVEEESLNLK